MDFVVNNPSGVENSKFLKNFSKDKDIQNLGLLLKMWGKKSKLIDTMRLSSYSLILMLLYFLMKTKKINFITDIKAKF